MGYNINKTLILKVYIIIIEPANLEAFHFMKQVICFTKHYFYRIAVICAINYEVIHQMNLIVRMCIINMKVYISNSLYILK